MAVYHGKPNTSGNSNSARRASVVNEGGSKFVNACTTAVESLSGDHEMRSSLAPEPQADTVVKTVDVNHVEVSSRSCDSPCTWASTIDCGGLAKAACVCKVDSASQLTSQFAPLSYLPVVVSDNEGNRCALNGLSDSGAEVALANTSTITELNPVDIGSVKSKGVIGEPISVPPLVRLNVALVDRPEHVVSFACAVTDQANSALILTADVVRKLMPQVEQSCERNAVGHADDDDDNDENDDSGKMTEYVCSRDDNDDDNDRERVTNENSVPDAFHDNIDVGLCSSEASTPLHGSIMSYPVGSIIDVPSNAEAASLKFEQLADVTLSGCFSLAKRNKGRFYFKNGVLHRVDVVAGQTVEQLVLPEDRRQQAIDLAHQTFGAHMGYKSTAKRLRYSFWWPTMARDTKTSVSRCDRCVRRARISCYDRVPIEC